MKIGRFTLVLFVYIYIYVIFLIAKLWSWGATLYICKAFKRFSFFPHRIAFRVNFSWDFVMFFILIIAWVTQYESPWVFQRLILQMENVNLLP